MDFLEPVPYCRRKKPDFRSGSRTVYDRFANRNSGLPLFPMCRHQPWRILSVFCIRQQADYCRQRHCTSVHIAYLHPYYFRVFSAPANQKKRDRGRVRRGGGNLPLFSGSALSRQYRGQFLRDSGRVLPVNYVRIDRSCRKQRFDSHERDSFRPYLYCPYRDSRWCILYCFHFHPGDLPHPDSGDFPAGNPLHTLRDRGQRLLSSGLLTHWNAGAPA